MGRSGEAIPPPLLWVGSRGAPLCHPALPSLHCRYARRLWSAGATAPDPEPCKPCPCAVVPAIAVAVPLLGLRGARSGATGGVSKVVSPRGPSSKKAKKVRRASTQLALALSPASLACAGLWGAAALLLSSVRQSAWHVLLAETAFLVHPHTHHSPMCPYSAQGKTISMGGDTVNAP